MRFRYMPCVVAVLTACGADDKGGPNGDPTDDNTRAVTVDNHGLTGQLYTHTVDGYGELDIATGILVQIRTSESGAPAPDGSELVSTVFEDSDLLDENNSTELVFFGRDGRATGRFGRPDYMYSPRLSYDKQRVAFEYHSIDDGDAGGVDILNITDRTGQLLGRYVGATWWDWAPDGSLFAVSGDTIYRVGPELGDGVPVKQFPGDWPTDLAVSPDGSQIAFGLGDRDLLENHVYVMAVDGSGMRQLTTSSLNEDAPAWSPDGKTIAVRQGIAYAALGAGIPGGGCPEVWLVPADSNALELASANADQHKMWMLEDGAARGVCAFGLLYWRDVPRLTSVAGAVIAGGGLNAGLEGTVFFDDPEVILAVDLASGASTRWPGEGGSPDASRDGTEVLIHSEEPDSEDYDDDQLELIAADGTVNGRILLDGSFLGAPRLSYDGQRIASRFNGPEDGGSYPIAIFSRDGDRLTSLPERFKGFTWAPDGRLLAVAANEVAVVDAAMTDITAFATFTDPIGDLAFSPDGSQIAFVMNGHVWVMHGDGSGQRQLTVSSKNEYSPEWSPDGSKIIVRYGDTCSPAYVVPADGARVFVGNPSVNSNAVALRRVEDGNARGMCTFSRVNWR